MTVREQRAKALSRAVAKWMEETLARTFETNELPFTITRPEWKTLEERFLEILP